MPLMPFNPNELPFDAGEAMTLLRIQHERVFGPRSWSDGVCHDYTVKALDPKLAPEGPLRYLQAELEAFNFRPTYVPSDPEQLKSRINRL